MYILQDTSQTLISFMFVLINNIQISRFMCKPNETLFL